MYISQNLQIIIIKVKFFYLQVIRKHFLVFHIKIKISNVLAVLVDGALRCCFRYGRKSSVMQPGWGGLLLCCCGGGSTPGSLTGSRYLGRAGLVGPGSSGGLVGGGGAGR